MISSAPGAGLRPILCAQQRAQREPLTREIGAALMRQDERIGLTTSIIIISIMDQRVHKDVRRDPVLAPRSHQRVQPYRNNETIA